ncbi:hypothetical protein DITRI_Ditri14bG0106300 [Diplodiscus trichospermus]
MDLTSLIPFLLEYVTPLVEKEALLFFGAKDEVRSLHAELKFIDKLLREFDDRFMEDVMVKEWLSQMQDVANEAKDVIERFVTENDIQKQRSWPAKIKYGFNHGNILRNVAGKVQKIKEKIKQIDGYRSKYVNDLQLANRNLEMAHWLEKRRREVEEENVVGFGDAEKQVIEMVVNKRLRRDVISVVGMAGSGKTTLAKMIYRHSDIEEQFQHRAWIFVPNKCGIRDMLLGILENLMPTGEETSKLDDVKLAEKLRRCLQGKNYLIVIDGLEKTRLWEDIEKFFPDEKCGSRILLTTRSTRVASQASLTTHTHSLQSLGERESLELLQKVVFHDETCPPELVNLRRQIATKCAGLPLAIVSLATLLARKRTYSQWVGILCNVRWYLNQEDSPPCFGILALNYDSLPQHLKLCMLYLGVFPNGFEIPARQVINLWIAEELIKETGGEKLEDIAERYLEELIDLSLIQVARRRSDSGVRTFRVHELWWNFCVTKGEREMFLDVHPNLRLPIRNKIRRLSIHYEASRYISSNPLYSSYLHSLLCFHNKGDLDLDGWTLIYRHFRNLRVLNLEDESTSVFRIPESIKCLSLLKYLKINQPSLKRLPSSLCGLPNLQTLDIKNTCVLRLPIGIWGMQSLRHLLSPRQSTLPEFRGPQKCSLPLQTLSAITPDRNTAHLISMFRSLIKLTLYSQDKWETRRCLECLHKLDCLQNLKIINPAAFPNSGSFPTSLVKVTLMKTDLIADKLGMVENLPHLLVLKLLTKSIRGPKLELRRSSFPQLRFLFMEDIVIRTWKMEDGAMKSLEQLTISRCHELETLPKQLWYLNTLRQVKVNSPSPPLKRMLEQLREHPSAIQIHF